RVRDVRGRLRTPRHLRSSGSRTPHIRLWSGGYRKRCSPLGSSRSSLVSSVVCLWVQLLLHPCHAASRGSKRQAPSRGSKTRFSCAPISERKLRFGRKGLEAREGGALRIWRGSAA